MDEFKTQRAVYTTEDLKLWQEKGILVITPKFQRRPVWTVPARSYFIDTVLRGMTVPPIYIRLSQNIERTMQLREIVDGQQRVRSVLDFINDAYRLSKNLAAPWAGNRFSQLSEQQKRDIMTFSFPTETFQGISDEKILQVFCRLNMNGVALNKQELRNGKFFGLFKQTAYSLAFQYLEFWRTHKLFSERGIARMLEVELTSELLIAGSQGMQDKKDSLDTFYSDWEEIYPTQKADEKRFNETMATISESFPEDTLAISAFNRAPLFYSLYCVVHHRVFGIPGVQRQSPRRKLTSAERDSLREAVESLSRRLAEAKDPKVEIPTRFKPFVLACQRQTDNINPRKTRFNAIYDAAF